MAISAPSHSDTCVPDMLALGVEHAAATFECFEQAPVNGHSFHECSRLRLMLLLLASLKLATRPLVGFDDLAKRAAPSIMRMLLLLATKCRPALMSGRCRWHLPAVGGL